MLKLSLKMGIPVNELSKRLSVSEFAEYKAYDRMHPIEHSSWELLALWMQLYCVSKTGKNNMLDKFFPRTASPFEQTDEELIASLKRIFGVKE